MTNAVSIDPSAVLWSAPESERADRPLLVVMHGYLSHEGDLFALSPYLPLQPVIASLRAPITMPTGHAWYPLDEPAAPSAERVNAAAIAVLDWLDSLPHATSVGLLGFSQGGAMAVQLMRHAPERFAYAVQLSGYVVPGELPGDAVLAQRRTPVFWGRGTHDDIIPHEAIEFTDAWLPAHSALDARVYEGLAHAVSQQELTDIAAFIAKQL